MLVAAPESSCGAVAEGDAERLGFVPGALASRAGRTNASAPTRASVLAAVAGEGESVRATSVLFSFSGVSNRDCWASLGCGTYSVAGVSSRELAKWAPMPLAFSAEDAIH